MKVASVGFNIKKTSRNKGKVVLDCENSSSNEKEQRLPCPKGQRRPLLNTTAWELFPHWALQDSEPVNSDTFFFFSSLPTLYRTQYKFTPLGALKSVQAK